MKVLKFLNLLDKDNNLSLTNVSVLVCIVKMCIPGSSIVDVGALLLALINYSHKRFESNKAIKEAKADVVQPIADLTPILKEIESLKIEHERITKLAEETQSTLSKVNLGLAFQPRNK